MAFTSAKIPPKDYLDISHFPYTTWKRKNMAGLLLLATAVGEIWHLAAC